MGDLLFGNAFGKYCEALSATQTNFVVFVREEKAHRTVGTTVCWRSQQQYVGERRLSKGRYGGRAQRGTKESFAGGMLIYEVSSLLDTDTVCEYRV
jgi:hypothetical protein